ncbi:MAG TPA: MFS transporter [Candidatus Saccharimonadia bacterium]|jgi:EmrB/QacA subfamily drug resistance transporter
MDKQHKLVLVVCILASFVAFLDGSVVNVALPAITREIGGGLAVQQWVVDAYAITLGALMLIAGSFSDLFGRKRIMIWGLLGFGVTSLACAVAPNGGTLVAARAAQGVAGALLVPSSLAMIIATFKGEAQGKAIGTWTAWTGIAFVIGPLLGGFLVDAASWRLVFAINVLPIALNLWLLGKVAVEEKVKAGARVDGLGAVLGGLGLAGPVFALIEQPRRGWTDPVVLICLVVGLVMLAAFLWHERTAKNPMLPLELFKIRNFSVGNVATTAIYAGLSLATFVIVVFEQQVGHFSALMAGLSLLPVTIIMFFLSPKFGALAGKHGPRLFMTVGPILGGLGFLWMVRVNSDVNYWTQLLPGVLMFGVGLSMTVAPLTAAVLGHIPPEHAGVGSAVNNAISRIAGLLAVATIGLIAGAQLNLAGFHRAAVIMAALLMVGGLVSALGITNRGLATTQ